MIVLSQRGALVSLSMMRRGDETITNYIDSHFRPRYQPTKDDKIEIKHAT